MYIRRTQREYKGKIHTNHLLVEVVQTPQGPRRRTICSLGSLAPAPAEDRRGLAHKIQSALEGQASLGAVPAEVERLSRRARGGKRPAASDAAITLEVEQVEIEEARQAGSLHVGHQVWRQLGLDAILGRAPKRVMAICLSHLGDLVEDPTGGCPGRLVRRIPAVVQESKKGIRDRNYTNRTETSGIRGYLFSLLWAPAPHLV